MGLFDKLFNKNSVNVDAESGQNCATYGCYRIVKETNQSIIVINKEGEACTPTKRYLREIADAVGLVYDNEWTTRTLGTKLIKFLNGNSGIQGNKASSVEENTRSVKTKAEKAMIEYHEEYGCPTLFDFQFKKINWTLNKKNIEKHYDELNAYYGAILIFAYLGEDRDVSVIAGCDTSDGLYDAMDIANQYKDWGYDNIEVYYTTVCEVYAAKDYRYMHSPEFVDDIGHMLESFLGSNGNYSYTYSFPVICRYKMYGYEHVWITDENGYYDTDIDGQNFDLWIKCCCK